MTRIRSRATITNREFAEPIPRAVAVDCPHLEAGNLDRSSLVTHPLAERIPAQPGRVLQEEFLNPLIRTQVALATHIDVPVQRINEIIRRKRGITPETAWLLAQALRTTAQFWVNLQANHDLASARTKKTISRLRKAG